MSTRIREWRGELSEEVGKLSKQIHESRKYTGQLNVMQRDLDKMKKTLEYWSHVLYHSNPSAYDEEMIYTP